MSNPYDFQPTPIRPVAVAESPAARANTPPAGATPGPMKIDAPKDSEPFMANLRQAAITATRNEIPVDQADMRSW